MKIKSSAFKFNFNKTTKTVNNNFLPASDYILFYKDEILSVESKSILSLKIDNVFECTQEEKEKLNEKCILRESLTEILKNKNLLRDTIIIKEMDGNLYFTFEKNDKNIYKIQKAYVKKSTEDDYDKEENEILFPFLEHVIDNEYTPIHELQQVYPYYFTLLKYSVERITKLVGSTIKDDEILFCPQGINIKDKIKIIKYTIKTASYSTWKQLAFLYLSINPENY